MPQDRRRIKGSWKEMSKAFCIPLMKNLVSWSPDNLLPFRCLGLQGPADTVAVFGDDDSYNPAHLRKARVYRFSK